MKKICCLVLSIFVITSVLVGCQGYDTVPNINTQNTEMLKEKYIIPIVKSGVYGNWENPTDDILPINFLNFYFYSGNLDYDEFDVVNSMYTHCLYYFNQDKVENFIMKYFDVTPEYIRKTEHYKKDKNAYLFSKINGGEIPIKITGTKQEKDILTIDYDILDINGETYFICETKIKLIDKDNYKYISCNRIDADMKKTNAVRGMLND